MSRTSAPFDPAPIARARNATCRSGYCERCGILTDIAIAYRPYGPLGRQRLVCTRHFPISGRGRLQQLALLQYIINDSITEAMTLLAQGVAPGPKKQERSGNR